MRIGLFTDAYLPDINGVVSSVVTLKESLEKLGHTVYVISNHKGTKVSLEDHVLRLPGLELKKFYGYKMSSPIQFSAVEYIIKMDLDIIHIQTEAGVGIFGRQMGKMLHIPIVYTYHTMYEEYTHYLNPLDINVVSEAEKSMIRTLSKTWANDAAGVIAPSDKTKQALKEYGVKSPIYVIPTGLDLDEFDSTSLNQEKVSSIRQQLNLTKDDHVVVFVGRIAKEKEIDIPIRAVAKSKDPRLHLVIVGGGTDEEYYKQIVRECHVEDRVHFMGRVPKSEVPYYYAAFDCFVSASTSETQGMTYIEALASGLLIFGRRDDVLKDLIDEGNTGYYFDDEDELVDKFDIFFSRDKEERAALRNTCIQKTVPYSTELFAYKALAAYNQTLEDYRQSYVVDRIQAVDDYMRLTVSRDCDERVEKFLIPMDEYFELKIEINSRLDAFMVQNYVELQMFYKAVRLVKRRVFSADYTIYEIKTYCRKKLNLNEDDTSSIIQMLKDAHLVDDHKYALEKAAYWQSCGQSRNEITKKLKKAGIIQEWIDEACGELNQELEKHNALQVARHIKNTIKGQSNAMRRQTLINRLIQKGYSMEIALEIGDSFEFDNEEGDDLALSIRKAKRLYSHFNEPKRTEKIRIYCMRKGFTYSQIEEALEGERND